MSESRPPRGGFPDPRTQPLLPVGGTFPEPPRRGDRHLNEQERRKRNLRRIAGFVIGVGALAAVAVRATDPGSPAALSAPAVTSPNTGALTPETSSTTADATTETTSATTSSTASVTTVTRTPTPTAESKSSTSISTTTTTSKPISSPSPVRSAHGSVASPRPVSSPVTTSHRVITPPSPVTVSKPSPIKPVTPPKPSFDPGNPHFTAANVCTGGNTSSATRNYEITISAGGRAIAGFSIVAPDGANSPHSGPFATDPNGAISTPAQIPAGDCAVGYTAAGIVVPTTIQ